MNFKSDLTYLADLEVQIDHKSVPQLYRSDFEFAGQNADYKWLKLLHQLQKIYRGDGFKYTSIDTRTHMLMKGMYPCIPGWHCDDFYRPTGDQPDLVNVEKEAPQKHYMIILGDSSRTEFLKNDIQIIDPSELNNDKPLYHYYDELIEDLDPVTRLVEPNKIYSFGPLAFHRGSAATHNGFRTFIRLTRSNHYEPKNETRYQTNVYLKGRISW